MVKTLLIFPPVWEPSQPYLSLPVLKSYLGQHGYNDVVLWDLNIFFHDMCIDSDFLTNLLLNHSPLSFESETERREIMQQVIPRIDWAKAVLRSEVFYEPEYLIEAKSLLEKAYDLISRCYAPSRLTAWSFVMRYRTSSSREVALATCDRKENPFISFYERHVLSQIKAHAPQLIGLSIADIPQIIPGMTLASLIRKHFPHVHITVGGTLFSKFTEALKKQSAPIMTEFVHSVVQGEGEVPLLTLVQALDNSQPLSEVPGLLYLDAEGQIQANPIGLPAPMNDTLAPDFDGLPFERYFSPQLILPLLGSRDCYWKECAFCDHYVTYAPRYRLRKPTKMAEDMAFLSRKYDTRYFSFGDETMSPNYARHLAQALCKQKTDVHWSMLSRLQKGFDPETCTLMKKGGCSLAIFGLESASPRISELMAKGIDLAVAPEVYRNLDQAGITNHSFIFFGFPTENTEDIRETQAFITRYQDIIHSIGAGYFSLKKFSPMFKQLEKYGIVELEEQDMLDDWAIDIGYKVSKGNTPEDARQAYRLITEYIWELYRGPLWLVDNSRNTLFLYSIQYGIDWLRQQDFRHKVQLELPIY